MSPDDAPVPALRLRRLSLRRFRNVARLDYEPGPRFNVLHGENGAGKSSLLEAIVYAATLQSFRAAHTEDLVSLGHETAVVEATFEDALPGRRVRVQLDRSAARRVTVDGRRPRSAAALHAAFHTVLFHPGDLVLALGAPAARRALLDRILGALDPTYARSLQAYDRALRSRNRLLKTGGATPHAIAAYDEVLAAAGAVIGASRAELVTELGASTEHAFSEIVGEAVRVSIRYRPRVTPTLAALRAALAASLERDVARGFTAEGPHADELSLDVKKPDVLVPARHHASQGQARALVLALKVAELSLLARRARRVPILLLDDVSSELDRLRNRRLFALLARLGGQVFLTTTQPELILVEEGRADFHVTPRALGESQADP